MRSKNLNSLFLASLLFVNDVITPRFREGLPAESKLLSNFSIGSQIADYDIIEGIPGDPLKDK